MALRQLTLLLVLGGSALLCSASAGEDSKKKHHKKHHHKRHAHKKHAEHAEKHVANLTADSHAIAPHQLNSTNDTSETLIISKMKQLEQDLSSTHKLTELTLKKGHLKVNAPVPADFPVLFATGVSQATGCKADEVSVLSQEQEGGVDLVTFKAPKYAALEAEKQASDPDSKLAHGPLRMFLMAREEEEKEAEQVEEAVEKRQEEKREEAEGGDDAKPSVDIDTEMPYGDLEPFGREDTAQELTESSIEESNRMVDQLERAEVAEEKRAVFRALTRLRGAAITSFDGVARAQTGNIDEYNRRNRWRAAHPLRHLAEDEADISKWAFPDGDF